MKAKVGVLGAGAWGTAVAKIIADKAYPVDIWALEPETVEDINLHHQNRRFLPDVQLPEQLRATNDISQAANDKDFIILATPSLYLLETAKRILSVPSVREGKSAIGVITKGFIAATAGPQLILEALEAYFPGFYRQSLVYIAGPSHAEEVARGKITGLIAASESAKQSIRFRDLLKSAHILVFSSFDVVGVQVCAAAKNIVAIGFGMLDALKTKVLNGVNDSYFGDGTESLLLAAGLNELQTLGRALGATHPETFTSISGVGDLDVTCRSALGRNRRFGREIIEKQLLAGYKNLDDLIARFSEVGYLAEGVVTAKHVNTLINKHQLRMPISQGIYRILNKDISPLDFLHAFVKDLG